MRPGLRSGESQAYAGALDDLWGSLSTTLARLERLADEPLRLAEPDAGEALPTLQYALHAASESAVGLAPPEGAERAHAHLASALAEARDVTAAVALMLHAEGPAGAAPLVYEWRGALFRVRLARLRLAEGAEAAAAEPEPPPAGRLTPGHILVVLVIVGTALAFAGALADRAVFSAGGLVLLTVALAYHGRRV